MKRAHVVLNLPLAVALAILFVFSSDLELFRPLKTESTYGYWVVVGVPIAALLMVAQIVLWVVWLGSRRRGAAG